MEIHHKRANVVTLFADIVSSYTGTIELSTMTGGQAMNAIPSDCRAVLGIDDIEKFTQHVNDSLSRAKNQYPEDQNITMTSEMHTTKQAVLAGDLRTLLRGITKVPVGVHEMHPTIENFVQTSTNLGTISIKDQMINIGYMTRGSLDQSLDGLISRLQEHYEADGYDVINGKKCPGRSQNPNDPFVNLITNQYEQVINKMPEKRAVHA